MDAPHGCEQQHDHTDERKSKKRPPKRSSVVVRLSPPEREYVQWVSHIIERLRPRSREECEGGARPCPFVSCRHNTYVIETTPNCVRLSYPDREPWDVPPDESCVLDIADRISHSGGVMILEEIARVLGLTRERVRQIEADGLENVRQGIPLLKALTDKDTGTLNVE